MEATDEHPVHNNGRSAEEAIAALRTKVRSRTYGGRAAYDPRIYERGEIGEPQGES